MRFIKIEAHRTGYSAEQAEDWKTSLTVGELIDTLSQYDRDRKVYISNDEGYTYGSIGEDDIEELEETEYEEEDE